MVKTLALATSENPKTSHTAFDRRMDVCVQPPPCVTHCWFHISCRDFSYRWFTEPESYAWALAARESIIWSFYFRKEWPRLCEDVRQCWTAKKNKCPLLEWYDWLCFRKSNLADLCRKNWREERLDVRTQVGADWNCQGKWCGGTQERGKILESLKS
jgi:hypothetical protein